MDIFFPAYSLMKGMSIFMMRGKRHFQARRTQSGSLLGRRVNRGLPKWPIVLLSFFMVGSGLLFLVDTKLKPSLATASSAVATRVATEALNQALTEELAQSTDASPLVQLDHHSDQGDLTVARFNLQAVTKLQSHATDRAEYALEELAKQTIQLPLGHVLGGSALSAVNISVPMRLSLLGNAHSSIYADVKSLGVNQTVHILYLDIVAQVNVVAPFITQPIQVESRAPIAYIVLSGPVPNAYYGTGGPSGQGGNTIGSGPGHLGKLGR